MGDNQLLQLLQHHGLAPTDRGCVEPRRALLLAPAREAAGLPVGLDASECGASTGARARQDSVLSVDQVQDALVHAATLLEAAHEAVVEVRPAAIKQDIPAACNGQTGVACHTRIQVTSPTHAGPGGQGRSHQALQNMRLLALAGNKRLPSRRLQDAPCAAAWATSWSCSFAHRQLPNHR